MKRFVIMVVILALATSLMGILPAFGQTDDNALVYKANLTNYPGTSSAYGEVMVWKGGEVKVKLSVVYEVEQIYNVVLEWGPVPPASPGRNSTLLGIITTDKHGKAIEYFNLSTDTLLTMATSPGFAIRKPGPGLPVAATVLLIPQN